MLVVEPRTAGIDVHKMQSTVSLRLCESRQGRPLSLTATFPTHSQGLREMVGWLADSLWSTSPLRGGGRYGLLWRVVAAAEQRDSGARPDTDRPSRTWGLWRSQGAGRDVWELRIDFGPGYCVYYRADGKRLVILLAAGTKKRQARAIARAQAYWKAYQQEKRRCQ